MVSKRIRIANNAQRKVNIINGDEIITVAPGERVSIYTKGETLKFSAVVPKKLSLLLFKYPALSKRYITEISPGVTLFFDSEIRTNDIYDDITLNERIYTYGHSIIFAFMKADIECSCSLLWQNKTHKNILRLILYFTSLLWIVVTGLLSAAGIGLLFEEFRFGYVIMCLLFIMLFVVGIKIFSNHRKFINITENTEEMLFESKPVAIINSTKYILEFKTVE